MKTISIVVPVYYNEPNLPETIPQLLALAGQLPEFRLELVFVDDGSGDRSLEILLDFHRQHPECIKVVKLTRNFGSMSAIQAGLKVASGHCIGMIAADLQDPPELFIEMVEHWQSGTKAVLAVRQQREDPALQTWFSSRYYALVRRFAIRDYPAGGFDFFLVDRQVVDEINRISEKNTNILTLIFWLGFRPVLIPYTRRKRQKGDSRWTLSKKIQTVHRYDCCLLLFSHPTTLAGWLPDCAGRFPLRGIHFLLLAVRRDSGRRLGFNHDYPDLYLRHSNDPARHPRRKSLARAR